MSDIRIYDTTGGEWTPNKKVNLDDTAGGTDALTTKAPTSNAFYDYMDAVDFYINKLNRLIVVKDHDTVTVQAGIPLKVGTTAGAPHFITTATDVNATTNLDTGSLEAGHNYYVYACNVAGSLVYYTSLSNTYPTVGGIDAGNSRKIGGFHTLCVAVNHGGAGHTLSHWVANTVMAVGQSVIAVTPETPCFIYRVTAIAGDFKTHAATEPNWASKSVGQTIVDDQVTWIKEQHTLEGYAVKDILPASIWDLKHRPRSNPEGMVYVTAIQKWVDIYLTGTEASTTSAYGATISDTRDWNDFCDDYAAVGKRMLSDHEFQAAAAGSNEETNITASADPVTTGGHVDTGSRRMVSNWGLEDCCGALWQWLLDQSAYVDAPTIAAGWYDLPGSKGQLFRFEDTGDVKLLAGGHWASGAYGGSRARVVVNYRWSVFSHIGGRALADPL